MVKKINDDHVLYFLVYIAPLTALSGALVIVEKRGLSCDVNVSMVKKTVLHGGSKLCRSEHYALVTVV